MERQITSPVLRDSMDLFIDFSPDIAEASPGKGTLPCSYAFVGMAPSPNRPKKRFNEPFGASSYAMLQTILAKAAAPVYLTNLVKEPIAIGRKLPKKLKGKYYPRLVEELKLVAPKRILALGDDVAKTLCPGFQSLREDHGTLFFNPELNAVVVPTYHFSAVMRMPALKPYLLRDLQRFFELPDPQRPRLRVLTPGDTNFDVMKPKPGERLYLDIETQGITEEKKSGLRLGANITFVGLVLDHSDMTYVLEQPTVPQLRALKDWILFHRLEVVGHNLAFDLAQLGYKTKRAWNVKVVDTMLLGHVMGERVLALKHMTTFYTARPGSRAFGDHNSKEPYYVAEDVLATRAVLGALEARYEVPYIARVLYRLTPVLAAMRVRGMYIDWPLLQKLEKECAVSLRRVDRELTKIAAINWDSPDQVVTTFRKMGIRTGEKTPTGAMSIAEAALLPLEAKHPPVALLLKHRELAKELDFYEQYSRFASEQDPYLRAHLKMTGTDTGRLSCEDPNLQQVPRKGNVKLLFRSRWRGGKFALCDLGQAELRVVAMLANDIKLARALEEDDVHALNAAIAYSVDREQVSADMRKKSKGVTFGVLYGGGAAGLAKRTGAGIPEVEAILEALLTNFPDLARYIKTINRRTIKTKKTGTLLGRVRDLTELILREGDASAKRKGLNTEVQGLASDINLLVLLYVSRQLLKLQMKTRPVMGVHDSLIFDLYPGEEKRFVELMGEAYQNLARTPLGQLELFPQLALIGEMQVGETWAHCESTNEHYAPDAKYEFSSLAGAKRVGITEEE